MAQRIRSRKRHSHTLRLTFSYEGERVELISQERVEMVPPPSDPVEYQDGQTGFWYDVRDATENTLYRRVEQNPIKFAVEVISEDPDARLTRKSVEEPRGRFILLVPDLDEARALVLFGSPSDRDRASEPAREIARFDLR